MRLFIAINFDDAFKRALMDICGLMKPHALKGRFTREENLHLTLVFLGEVPPERLPLLIETLSTVKSSPFRLKTNRLGCFKQRDGDLYWLGIDKSDALNTQNHDLLVALDLCKKESGFDFHPDGKAFKPHLTLGRGMVMDAAFDAERFRIEPLYADVGEFSLMDSEVINGKRVYTALYTIKF